MATAIQPGGAYLSPDKKTWHDANGNLIDAPASVSETLPYSPVSVSVETEVGADPESAKAKTKGK